MGRAEAAGRLRVEVAFSAAPREVEVVSLDLPPGSLLGQALSASGLLERHGLALESLACGIWGRRQALNAALRDGDRIELYRPLTVDPKQARRLRHKGQRKAKRPAGAGR